MPLITKEDLLTTHCEKYVDRYLIGDLTELELRNVGFPWSREGVTRLLSSTGGTLAAALAVCNTRKEQLRLSSGGRKIDSSIFDDENIDDDDDASATAQIKLGPLFAAHVARGTQEHGERTFQ